MTLLKIPMLVVAAILNHRSLTPPPLDQPLREKEKYTPESRVTQWVETGVHACIALFGFLKFVYTVVVICECASILAVEYPNTNLGAWILSRLYKQGTSPALELDITQPSVRFILSFIATSAGCLFRLRAFSQLGTFFTFKLSKRDGHKLVTSGPYAIVRHPSYTDAIAGIIGSMFLLTDVHSWLLQSGVTDSGLAKAVMLFWFGSLWTFASLLAMRTATEDEMMKMQFGQEWEAWAGKVPWRLFPGVY